MRENKIHTNTHELPFLFSSFFPFIRFGKHFIAGKKKNIFKGPDEEFSSTLACAQSRKSIKFSIVITP